VYFISHLDEAGLLDASFNPYLGKNIHVKADGLDQKERTQENIQFSPGFAPLCLPDNEKAVRHNGEYYGYCTSLFNVPRKGGKIHTGVDLSTGGSHKDIVSLIYGEVWECAWMGTSDFKTSYGKIMLIRGLTDDKLYLLAHLEDYLKKTGDKVEPHDHVAIAGTTGNSTGIHLHVEVLIDAPKTKDGVYTVSENKKLEWSKERVMVNPFDHTEKFGTWKGN
jgi:murein DD-endopeptidase MepM/ murein hydrolase activator NlpD